MANEHDIQTVTEEGTPARQRFKDAGACYQFARRLEKDDQDNKSPVRRQIMSMRNGAPPWKRSADNLDRMNINWGEGKQVLKDRKVPFLTRLAQEAEPIEVETWEKDPQRADNQRRQLTTGISAALNQWTGSARELSGAADDMGSFGLGIVFWPEDRDPRFQRVPNRRCFFPADSVPDIDRINAVVIKHTWYTTELWDKHESKQAEEMGWSKRGIREVLSYLYNQSNERHSAEPQGSVPVEDLETRIRSNYMGEWISGNQVDIYHVVYRDFSGKFSSKMVTGVISKDPVTGKSNLDGAVYLFEKDDHYEELSQFMGIFPLCPDEETIQALQGYGHELVPKAKAASRAKCQLMDHWDRSTTLWYQAASTDAAMRFSMHRRGPYGVVSAPGLEIAEIAKQDKMPADLGALGMLESELRRGTPTNTPNLFGRAANRPSATAEEIQEAQANEAVIVDVSLFELNLDRVYAEFYRRCQMPGSSKGAPGERVRKVFHDWMRHLELPREVWQWSNIRQVKAKRTVGPGSPFVRRQAANFLMNIRGAFPPQGQHEAVELAVAAYAGAQHVRRFLPTFDRLSDPTHHNWQANQESLAIKSGQSILQALGDQNDSVHIQQHLGDFEPELQAIQQGAGEQFLVSVAGMMANLMPHLDSHLQRLEADETRKAQFEALKPQVEEYRRIALSLDRQARQITEAQRQAEAALQNQGGNIDMEEQIKVEAKARELMMKEQAHQQKMEQSAQSFQAEEGRRETEFRLDQDRKLREAQLKALTNNGN